MLKLFKLSNLNSICIIILPMNDGRTESEIQRTCMIKDKSSCVIDELFEPDKADDGLKFAIGQKPLICGLSKLCGRSTAGIQLKQSSRVAI